MEAAEDTLVTDAFIGSIKLGKLHEEAYAILDEIRLRGALIAEVIETKLDLSQDDKNHLESILEALAVQTICLETAIREGDLNLTRNYLVSNAERTVEEIDGVFVQKSN